jgi:thioester reductase-like protein
VNAHESSPTTPAARKTVLLTGGSGLLGTALIESIRSERVIALCHRSPITRAGVEILRGDIRQPLLGLSEHDYADLADRVDVIIHSASITRLGVADAKILDTNVNGTREIVRLARAASARLIYLSTAFVHQGASDVAPASMYEESKRQAEALVRTLVDDFVILRPSIIVGDSRTGRVAAYQGLHEVVGSMVDRSLPVLPATPGMFCDFVAQDWVTDAIWAAASHPRPAQELWITSGTRALSVEACVAVAVRIGDAHGFQGPAPRIVSYDTIQRLFVPVFLDSLPGHLRRRFQANLKLARYMNQKAALPSSEPYLRSAFGLPQRETPEVVLVRNMERWCAHRSMPSVRSRRSIAGAEREPLRIGAA